MSDTIVTLGSSLIQHGTFNDRIYLLKLAQADFPQIITELDRLAQSKGYSKIFAKIPADVKDAFLEQGYTAEAVIPHFYNGRQTAYFLGKYFSSERKTAKDGAEVKKVLALAQAKSGIKPQSSVLPEGFAYRECRANDIREITELYKKVFETYPFPIHDPAYIEQTMNNNVTYFGVWHEESLVALASAEMDRKAGNAEMTDFAALPDYRSKGLSSFLLQTMEKYIKKLGLKTAYTIARALSYGMNVTFAKMGYTYSGTLVNNTNISGRLESMNVWYKQLR